MFARVFLAHQINSLTQIYHVSIITNIEGKLNLLDNISDEVSIIDIPIKREINLIYDLYVLFLLIIILRKSKFSLVHSANPKAGLIAAIAAWISRVPNRLHTFTGQTWATSKGIQRWMLRLLDKLVVMLNSQTLVDSNSQKEFLVREGVLKTECALVLGAGSISGVDLKRFKPSEKIKRSILREFNIPKNSIVFLFVGRLKQEKGVFELVEAFKNISKDNENAYLFIVGPDEQNLKNNLIEILDFSFNKTRFIGFTKTPEEFMMASDIFVMPSYREGFGTSVIEAASCGIPSIGSNVYGLSDSIKDGVTGELITVCSKQDLEAAMTKLLSDNDLRTKMGDNARQYAKDNFSQDSVTHLLIDFYKGIIVK